MGGLREGLGRLGYRSVTHPEARPGPTGPGRAAERDAVLRRPRRAGPISRLPYDPVRQIAEDHAIGNLDADAGLPALVLERHLDGRPERVADTCLRDSRAGDRYLLCSDRLSPVAVDRPHFSVQTLRAAYADALPSWPSWPGLVSMFRLTLYHGARALHARQAGSRLPLTAQDGARRSAAMYGCSDRPRERPPRPSCPMLPDVVAYHRRDNLPGQIRA